MIVRESSADVPTPTGPMRVYLYAPHEPTRPPRTCPGLLLYSEIFQRTAPVARLAVAFAGRGYVVAVPEVYHAFEAPGTVLGYDDAGRDRGNALKAELSLAGFDDDVVAALAALAAHPGCDGRFGAVGICLGGHLAFRAALNPKVKAAACFYGTDLHTGTLGVDRPADTLARCREISGELLMAFGRQDPHIPGAGRRAIYDALDAAGVWFTWHEFNAAHAFLRDEGERYDPAAAHLCLSLATDLFDRCL